MQAQHETWPLPTPSSAWIPSCRAAFIPSVFHFIWFHCSRSHALQFEQTHWKDPALLNLNRAVPVSLDGLSVLSFLEGAYKFQFKLSFLMRNNIVAFCWDVCLKWWKVESEKSRYEQRFLPASCYTTGTVVSSPGLANVFGQGPESRDFRPCRL